MAYTSSQIVQAVPTGINSALVLIKSQTIGTTVSSVEVTGAFSSTYDTYLITVSGGAGSTQTDLKMTLGATTSDYAMSTIYSVFTNTVSVAGSSAQASWLYAGTVNTTSLFMNTMLQNPFLTEQTFIQSFFTGSTIGGISGGVLNNTTSYTAFTIAPVSGTITGGTIRVYGYTNS